MFIYAICFGRYWEGIPALNKTELQTRVMYDLLSNRTAIIKFDNNTTLTQVFEANDVLPQDIVKVRAGKHDDSVDVDKESFSEITLDDLNSYREILYVKVIAFSIFSIKIFFAFAFYF